MTNNAKAITELNKVLAYDAESGWLTWKVSSSRSIKVGSRAGRKNTDGYRYVKYCGVVYIEHRVAFALTYGRWPTQIDHINMDRDDNRLVNLREATIAENNRNRTKQRNNTSGYKGVTFHKGTGKFQAKITLNKNTKSLGYYQSAELAALAYESAAKEMHNEFARS